MTRKIGIRFTAGAGKSDEEENIISSWAEENGFSCKRGTKSNAADYLLTTSSVGVRDLDTLSRRLEIEANGSCVDGGYFDVVSLR